MKWNPHYKIADGNVRPWFFEYKNALYLLNTTQERERRYTNISRIRTLDTEIDFFDDTNDDNAPCAAYDTADDRKSAVAYGSKREPFGNGHTVRDTVK